MRLNSVRPSICLTLARDLDQPRCSRSTPTKGCGFSTICRWRSSRRSTASSRRRAGPSTFARRRFGSTTAGPGRSSRRTGLIMTNHHVGADTLSKLGTKDHDYYRDGFFAHSYEEEAKAPDLELNVLIGIEDVTDRVNRGSPPAWTTPGRPRPAARPARQSRKKRPRRTACATTSSRSIRAASIILYTYKKYTDVRLVFAPEFDIAFFGGDPDNFEYPALRPRRLLLPGL